MKINPNSQLREIAGASAVFLQGKGGADLTKIVSMNASACMLYQHFYGKDFSLDEVAQALRDTYNIDMERSLNDAKTWVDKLKDCHVISE